MTFRNISRGWMLCLALLLPVSMSACSERNPATGESQFMMFSEEQEIELGQGSMTEFEAEFGGRVNDSALQSRVQKIGVSLAKVSHRPELPYTFYALNSDIPNAFSLPGGPVYITMGLIKLLENKDDSIAAVMGHEIGHIAARHSVVHLQKALGLNLLLVAISSAGSDKAQVAAAGGQVVGTMVLMKHGRADEYQADELGMDYLVATGRDPNHMIVVMKKLMTLEQGDRDAVSDLMRSHPHSEDRVKNAADYIAKRRAEGKFPKR